MNGVKKTATWMVPSNNDGDGAKNDAGKERHARDRVREESSPCSELTQAPRVFLRANPQQNDTSDLIAAVNRAWENVHLSVF